MLLSSPVTSSHLGIFASVKDFLMQLLSTRSGLLYLCSRPDQTNGIIRALTQVIKSSFADSFIKEIELVTPKSMFC